MKHAIVLLVCACALTACGPKKTVDAEALAGVMNPVLDRHDAYVLADDSLTSVESDTALRSSAIIRDMVTTSLGE